MVVEKLKCLQHANAILGEGPLWHQGEGALYWIDILRPAIYRYTPGTGQTGNWPMPSAVGAIGLAQGGRLVVALEHQAVSIFDPATAKLQPLADPIAASDLKNIPGRYNDGRVDAMGNFWTGWLTHDRQRPGALFRIEPSGRSQQILNDPVAPNGLGWSVDGRTMYVTDSHINTIWAYDCDLTTGALGARREFARQDRDRGIFDGLCVDAQDGVWTALYGGGAVLCLSPDGSERQKITVPCRLVTACAIGARQSKTLFITTAVRDQAASDLIGQPAAGAVFSVDVNFAGMPEPIFGLTNDTKMK